MLVLQVPQVQFLEKVVDVPVVCNVRCWPCLCSELWRSPQLQSIGQLVRRLRRLMDEQFYIFST